MKPITGIVVLSLSLITVLLPGCGEKSIIGTGTQISARSESVSANVSSVNARGGSIEGVVNSKFLFDTSCTRGNAVYVFDKHGTIPDDADGIGVEPVDIIYLDFDSSTHRYNYRVPFLKSGDYTLAFTCQAGDDSIDSDDAIHFMGITSVTVSDGQKVIKHMFARNM